MARINLQAPWIQFYEKMELLFKEDPFVRVIYDEGENEIKLYASNVELAAALERVLPAQKEYGAVTQTITVVPPNGKDISAVDVNHPIVEVLDGNPIVDKIECISGIFGYDIIYIAFRREVVQYYNDDISCLDGICSTLYQELAKDVFISQPGVFFCTA